MRKGGSMNYANETFYHSTYLCGKEAVIATAFDFYARKATQEIKRYVFGNIDENNIPDAVKNCCCEIAEILYSDEHTSETGVSSESVGGWSRSYESSETRKSAINQSIRDSVYAWLSDTGLLYRGIG